MFAFTSFVTWIKEHKKLVFACLVVIAVFIAILTWGVSLKQKYDQLQEKYYDDKYHVTTYSLEDQAKLTGGAKLKFENERRDLISQRSTPVVQEIVRTQYIQGEQPVTVVKEVQHVARGGRSDYISQDTQNKIQEKSDETKIIEEEKSVDVYKINHEKNLKIKVGATYLDNKAYVNYGVQYKRVEGIVHTKDINPAHIDGGTIMWTAYQR